MDREIEIPGMEEDMLVYRTAEAVVDLETDVTIMNPANNQNETVRQKEKSKNSAVSRKGRKGKFL
mgnify:CR=1 FL=1